MVKDIYFTETYLKNNPGWHTEDSEWKASKIYNILIKNSIKISSLVDIGCGFGKVLEELDKLFQKKVDLTGYEISPSAFSELPNNSHIKFINEDYTINPQKKDVAMAIDVIEHIYDYRNLLHAMAENAEYQLFHIPLDLSVVSLIFRHTLPNTRKKVGHIHLFTKELALEMLNENNLEIVEIQYTRGSIELTAVGFKEKLGKIIRYFMSLISDNLASLIFGGYSLLILTKRNTHE